MSRIFETPLYPYKRCADQDAAAPVRHPVVVVGAGPIGLAAAIDLAQHNVPVVVLDENDKVSWGSRAICFAKRPLEILDRLGIAEHAPKRAEALSGGQQQRVAIARALITEPAVLLADEPTGSLDTRTSNEIMELITGLNTEIGITVVMVTHEENVARYASRRMQFLDGTLERAYRPGRGDRQENGHVS